MADTGWKCIHLERIRYGKASAAIFCLITKAHDLKVFLWQAVSLSFKPLRCAASNTSAQLGSRPRYGDGFSFPHSSRGVAILLRSMTNCFLREYRHVPQHKAGYRNQIWSGSVIARLIFTCLKFSTVRAILCLPWTTSFHNEVDASITEKRINARPVWVNQPSSDWVAAQIGSVSFPAMVPPVPTLKLEHQYSLGFAIFRSVFKWCAR